MCQLCRATYVFDEASGHPALLLQQVPLCFGVRRAVLGVRYDTFRISGMALYETPCMYSVHLPLTYHAAVLHHICHLKFQKADDLRNFLNSSTQGCVSGRHSKRPAAADSVRRLAAGPLRGQSHG